MAPRLGEIRPSAVIKVDAEADANGGTPFPPLQHSPEVTATGKSTYFFITFFFNDF